MSLCRRTVAVLDLDIELIDNAPHAHSGQCVNNLNFRSNLNLNHNRTHEFKLNILKCEVEYTL